MPRLVGLAVASTVLLSGCGAVPALNAGSAARVGDETIPLSEVSDTSAAYCEAVETQLEEGQAVASSVVSGQVAGALTLQAAAEQWAAAEGLEPDASYESEQQSLESAISGLSPSQQEAVRAVNLARPYAAAVQIAYGKQQVEGDDAALAAGQQAFADWLDEQDVRIDPRFGITVDDGQIAAVDTNVSYAVSATAKNAAKTDDATYAAGLPSTQRCG